MHSRSRIVRGFRPAHLVGVGILVLLVGIGVLVQSAHQVSETFPFYLYPDSGLNNTVVVHLAAGWSLAAGFRADGGAIVTLAISDSSQYSSLRNGQDNVLAGLVIAYTTAEAGTVRITAPADGEYYMILINRSLYCGGFPPTNCYQFAERGAFAYWVNWTDPSASAVGTGALLVALGLWGSAGTVSALTWWKEEHVS